ncbi:putative leucine-rich repeat receptor-like protein [Drosera capensis]
MKRRRKTERARGVCLLEIKSNLLDEYGKLSNWSSHDETPCRWEGVTCSPNGHDLVVSSLNISSMNVSGTLSSSIGCLSHLRVLDVSFNSLSGSIPWEIGNCLQLQTMFLQNNEFY